MAVEEIPDATEKQCDPQETPLPTSSNSLTLTPITTIYDNPTFQDSPLPSSDQLDRLLGHLAIDPFPFFHPAAAAGSLVSSIDGETSSAPSSSSGPQQEPPFPNNISRMPYVWVNRPPPQFYKLNVAVVPCIDETIGFLGLGIVVRDHFAVVHQALSFIWDRNLNQNLDFAEYYVYSLGIRICINHFPRLIAEAEGLMLVRQYQQDYNTFRFDSFEARNVSLNDNRLARAFATRALQIDNIFWTPQQIVQYFGSVVLPF